MLFARDEKIKTFDIIVVGNNIAAVITAGLAAEKGRKVALVTESELLFSEFSEGMLGFLKRTSPFTDILIKLGATPVDLGEELHIPRGMASKIALKYLRDNNVVTLLKVAPVALLKKDETVCGIAVANKFGSYALEGGFVVDFSDRVFYEKNYENKKENSEYIYAFQTVGVDLKGLSLPYKLNLDLEDVKNVILHGDSRSEDTCLITFETGKNTTPYLTGKALEIFKYLNKNNTRFAHSGISKLGFKAFKLGQHLDIPQKGLLSLETGSILNDEDNDYAVIFTVDLFSSFQEYISYSKPNKLITTYGEFDLSCLYEEGELDEFLGVSLPKIKIPTHGAPTLTTDLFIAGMGTGGAAAFRGATQMGCDVIGAEAMFLPGGTRTLGTVVGFWHGYQGGFVEENKRLILEFSKENLGKDTAPYVAEALYDVKVGEKSTVFYNTFVFDAITEENKVIGAVLATPDGIVKVLAKANIDATGDGDFAMLSSAEYMPNGDVRDGVTQGYSIWGEDNVGTHMKDSLYKSDEDSISTETYSEFLRGIFTSHSVQSDLGFSPMLTVRESRRIKGKYVLNMEDILRGKVFDDTIALSLCQYDAHGMGSSPAYYTSLFEGLMPNNKLHDVCTRIPLRCLLPEKIEGLMVIAKSISATRDASCLIRMNADIQNVGYAAGVIAANSVKNSLDFESAFSGEIKEILVKKGILPDFYNKNKIPSAKTLLDGIEAGDKWAITVATVYKEFLPDFEAVYKGDDNLARVLAAMGSDKGFYDMLKNMEKSTEIYKDGKTSAAKIKTYAVLLSRLAAKDHEKKAEFLPVLKKAIEVMDAGGDYIDKERGIYQNSKVSNRIVPNFKTIMGLCIAAETVADPMLIPALEGLLKRKNISLEYGREIHSVQLYLRIIAASVRCSDKQAKKELEEYLNSPRLFFREFAKNELEKISLNGDKVTPAKVDEFWI